MRWEVHTTGSGPHPIEFSTWQFDSVRGTSLVYTLMGVNYFPSAAPNQENNVLSLAVTPSQQIQVFPGDIVGIRSILARDSNVSSPFQMQLVLASDDGVLFYGLEDSRTNVTPQAVEVTAGSNTFLLLRGRPVLRVTVEEGVVSDTDSTTVNTTPSSTASTPETTTTIRANEDLVTIIVPVVVCVGVALLLVIALVILVMVCVGVRRRRRKLEKAALHRDSIRLTSNNAYGHREVIMDDVESDVYYSTIQDIQ